mgnify:CR=1 FL=1
MNRCELLIFDWDGTLMDSAAQIVAAMRQAIGELDLPPRSDREMSRLIGLGLEDAFSRLYPELGPADLAAIFARYRTHFRGRQQTVYGQAFDGVENELQRLAAAGYDLAIATGKSRKGLDQSLHANRWNDHFVASRCADETAPKPHPRMLEELLLERALEAPQALMIGDTSYDMEMARRAGVPAVGVAWGVHEADELLAAGALVVLPGITGLGDWLRDYGRR